MTYPCPDCGQPNCHIDHDRIPGLGSVADYFPDAWRPLTFHSQLRNKNRMATLQRLADTGHLFRHAHNRLVYRLVDGEMVPLVAGRKTRRLTVMTAHKFYVMPKGGR